MDDLEGLRAAQRLLDQYEELWRGRIDRMTELVDEQGTPAMDIVGLGTSPKIDTLHG